MNKNLPFFRRNKNDRCFGFGSKLIFPLSRDQFCWGSNSTDLIFQFLNPLQLATLKRHETPSNNQYI